MSPLSCLGLQIHWRDLRILHGHRDCWRKLNNWGCNNYHNYSASWQMPAVIWQSSIVWRLLWHIRYSSIFFDILRDSSTPNFQCDISKFEVCLRRMYLDRSSSGVATNSSRGEGGSRLLGLCCTCWYKGANLRFCDTFALLYWGCYFAMLCHALPLSFKANPLRTPSRGLLSVQDWHL